MGETFYSSLGVDVDADEETIRRAYRAHVKETHPDVSDDPAATDTFKRLTTARDVLVDVDERTLYDRIGHDSYVSEHVESSVWDATDHQPERAHDGSQSGRSAMNRDCQASEEWWDDLRGTTPDETWTWEETRTRRRRTSAAQKRQARSDGGYANESWQTASEVYTRTDNAGTVEPTPSVRERVSTLLSLGPWLIVHFVLLSSTLATVGFMYTHFISSGALSVLVFACSVLLVSLVLALSGLHIAVQLSVNR